MSASIYWRLVEPKTGHIDVGAPSAFVQAMTKVFGPQYPWRLTRAHVATLHGMAALCCDGAEKNPYDAIIDKIENDDGTANEIDVWPEY
jgi:hypothetical protein